MICLTLTGATPEENAALIKAYGTYIDLVEVRLDLLHDDVLKDMQRVTEGITTPAIATFRRAEDGGSYNGSENYRIRKLFEAVEAGFQYIDVEYNLEVPDLVRRAEQKGVRVVRSFHSFTGVPENLEIIIRQVSAAGQVIPKAAVYPRTSAEALRLYRVIENLEGIEEKIILGMGDFGFFTRILYKKLGSFLTFCSAEGGKGAPGHVTPRELRETYNVGSITARAAVFGIIGNPVMHSLSPRIHNAGYRAGGLDMVYVPFPVDDIRSFLELARGLNIQGFSVTVPYKKAIVPFLARKDALTEESEACNTVRVTGSGLEGWNTDVNGFLEPLRKRIPLSEIKKTAVIGAGGAAAAVVRALKQCGTEIHICNRTRVKADSLAEISGGFSHSLDDNEILAECDLIVQTTSVGMTPHVSQSPIPGYRFSPHQIAYDIIYTPPETLFLKTAREQGCTTINGMEMLLAQGKRQFELFTGKTYPETGAYSELLSSFT